MPDLQEEDKRPLDEVLENLRVQILALKMATFTSIEPDAADEIKYMIEMLPSAEDLSDVAK